MVAVLKLSDVHKLIEESNRVNRGLLDVLRIAVDTAKKCEDEFLEILRTQKTDLTLQKICATINVSTNDGIEAISDLVHLIEFEKVIVKKYKTKLNKLLAERRKCKLIIGYSNRVQRIGGFTNSIYWYNRNCQNDLFYTIQTSLFEGYGFQKGQQIQQLTSE